MACSGPTDRHVLQRLLVWLALLAYGLTAGLPGRGVVLCFEADGHVTIEIAGGGCTECCPADEPPRDAPARDAGVHLDSCPCIDVALVGAGVLLAKTKAGETAGPGPLSLAAERLDGFPTPCSKIAPPATRPNALRNSSVELVSCVILRV